MSDFVTIQVKHYRLINDWTGKTILETKDFEDACEEKIKQERDNQHDEFLLLAVIDA